MDQNRYSKINHNKEKLDKKYLIQKRFLINKVFHEIFKKIPTDAKTDYFSHCFIQDQKNMKRIWKKIMQIKNVNKRFKAIPTMIKHENHTIDNRAKLSENSNDFLRPLVKSLKLKFLHPMIRSMRMLMLSSASNHEDFSNRQH